MSRHLLLILVLAGIVLQQCRVVRELQQSGASTPTGMEGLRQVCMAQDTIQSILISKAEAILVFDDERYEVTITLFSKKDSIIYISAVNSGFEILRASVEPDSIKVIDRIHRIVYRTPLYKRFGYQHPVNFRDLQNVISRYSLCDDMEQARDDYGENLSFEFDENYIKKRIFLDRTDLRMNKFEFYHSRTNEYLMGERTEGGYKTYSNFIIKDFEIITSGGVIKYNQERKVRMDVNHKKYSFVEL
ncbi:MAG: DUF4292 domain-containing protein [Bacteroidales bacterium]|nr:DUF4292 domain-containing protein [Bacteroidales bacterium]